MDIKDLKNEIDKVMMHITIGNMLLWFINEPQNVANFKKTFVVDIAGFIKKDGTGKELPLHSAFDYCRGNREFNLEYLKKVLMVEINWIFENLPKRYQYSYENAYDGKNRNTKEVFSKEFEFFRHIRNACSHGNKFNLKNSSGKLSNLFDKGKNPYYEASWRNFTIDPNANSKLDESELFFTFLESGDAIELLEFIKNSLEAGCKNIRHEPAGSAKNCFLIDSRYASLSNKGKETTRH